jgi:hypothetical protein
MINWGRFRYHIILKLRKGFKDDRDLLVVKQLDSMGQGHLGKLVRRLLVQLGMMRFIAKYPLLRVRARHFRLVKLTI